MELIGIGDLHFDKMDGLIPSASSLICKALRTVFSYAIKNGVRHIVFYGDIGEKPRLSYGAQVAFYKLLLDDKYADLVFHIILGNHDFAEDGTHSLQVLETVCDAIGRPIHVYTQATRTVLDGVSFNFLPYPHTQTTKNAINVGHFEVAGSFRDNGRKIDDGLTTNHLTLMGHLHTKHRVRKTFYSGTLYQTNFGEVEKKFFHHVKAKSHKPEDVEVTCVPFTPPWRLVNLTVRTEDDLKVIEDDPRVLYKLFLKDGSDIDIDRALTRYPNIVKHNTFKNKQDLEQLVQQAWDFGDGTETDVVNIDDTSTNVELLKQLGWSSSKVSKAISIIDRVKGTK